MNQDFLKRMKEYLKDDEYNALVDAYTKNPVRSFRINKIDEETFFKNIKIDMEKIEYDIDGYYLNSSDKFGNHPYHHLGAMYIQEPSAMAPVNMYQFKGNEKVLDLCAAPGGKSSQILRRIPNGLLVSNDPSPKRSKVLFGNLERLGYSNAIVTNETPNRLESTFGGFFDVVLVDAPCSGEGMMRKEAAASQMWSLENILECAKRDKEILMSADKMLKQNGILIYSTCTFAKEENENIISYLVDELGYEILPANPILKKYTKEGYISNTLRFYPFTGNGEGQFMAVLRKKTESISTFKIRKPCKPSPEQKMVEDFINENLNLGNLEIIKEGNRYYSLASDVDLSRIRVINYGVELGEVSNKRFIPYHHLFKSLGKYFKNKLCLEINDQRVLRYIHGEEIEGQVNNGYGVIQIGDLILGGFKASNGRLKNHYPKGLRNMNLIEED